MNPRIRVALGLTWLILFTFGFAPLLRADEPLKLQSGTHPFVDDYVIESSRGLVRTMHQPEKLPELIIARAEPRRRG